jgi:urease accessory protein
MFISARSPRFFSHLPEQRVTTTTIIDRPMRMKPKLPATLVHQDLLLEWLPQLLQTNDSLFPTGNYAHSFGLEGMVQLELVTDVDSFARFMHEQILPALRRMELPFVRFAYDAAIDGNVARLCKLDECYGATKGSFELRQVSSRIGAQRLHMLLRLAPGPLVQELERARFNGRFQAHAPVVFGAQAALNKTPIEAALAGYYYQALAALLSAAMKLLRLGQMGAQALLTEWLRETKAAIADALTVDENDAGWFQLVLEIASARHETAYTRIFIS